MARRCPGRPCGCARVLEVVITKVDDVDAVLPRAAQPLVDQVDTDHPDVPVMCDLAGHRADRAQAEHQQRAALGRLDDTRRAFLIPVVHYNKGEMIGGGSRI